MGLLRRLFGNTTKDIELNGHPAKATIVSLREGGPYVNGRPTITMELDVDSPVEGAYRAQARQRVDALLLARLAPGSEVPVRVDPKDRARAVLDKREMLGQTDSQL